MKGLLPRLMFFSVFLFSLSSCGNFYSLSEKERVANEVKGVTALKLSKKYNMQPVGHGASMMEEIKMLALSFVIEHPLIKKKARELIVDCVEEFLQEINANKEIRPYLANVPFTAENIEMAIFIHDEKNNQLFHPDLCLIDAHRGTIFFRTCDPDHPFGGYASEEDESYEEAAKLVQEDRRSE